MLSNMTYDESVELFYLSVLIIFILIDIIPSATVLVSATRAKLVLKRELRKINTKQDKGDKR